MFKPWLVALALLVASVPARAQKPKYTRTQDVKVDVKLSDRVKPVEKPAQAAPARPDITATQAMAIEGLMTPIQAEMEAQLLDLIRDTPDTEVDEKADLYFRLGELY